MFTWLEIDKKAIQHNLRQFRKMIGKGRLLMPVIKANAYGHGFLETAKICAKSPEIDRICVVNDDEALLLAGSKTSKKIQILSFFEVENEKKALILAKKGVVFPLFSLKQAVFLDKVGERVKKKIKVHIKVDTGATRVGLLIEEVLPFLKKIKKLSHLEIEGLYSHFASSEEDRIFTEHQIKIFNQLVGELEKNGFKVPIKHFACSSASILYKKSWFNGLRLGLSMYGLYPEDSSKRKIKLRPALSWKTKIMQVKTVPAWTKVGYGGTFTAKKNTKLAVLPVGYWDGYDRKLSNKAFVLIHGKKCQIRGRICMNMCMVDVSNLKNVKVGDQATLIGRDKKQKIMADDLAAWAGTINYEIVDRINPLLPRIYG